MKNTVITTFIGVGLAISAGAANAASLNTSGTWTNSQPASGISGNNTNQISWGNPANPQNAQSSYVFEGVSDTVDIDDLIDAPFLLGEFTHNNFPITGTTLTSTTLNVDLNIDSFNQLFSFGFTHFETPNGASPCAAGGVQPCPDLVSFPNGVSDQLINIDGVDYNLTLIGFSQHGPDNAVDEFLTLEAQSNTAGLYAQLTAVETPEPASLLGMITVGGAAIALRQGKQKRALKS